MFLRAWPNEVGVSGAFAWALVFSNSTAICGQCRSWLLAYRAKSSQGTIYPYFVCASRNGGRGNCTRQAMLIEQVERLVERFYAKVPSPGGSWRRSRRGFMPGSTR